MSEITAKGLAYIHMQEEIRRLRAKLARCLVLEPVDLEGEVEDGDYLCLWKGVHGNPKPIWSLLPAKVVDAPYSKGVKILRAYGAIGRRK